MTPTDIAHAFIERINSHTPESLCELMTEDHTFVDGLGNVMKGRSAMRDAWQGYFAMMPDYRIVVERVFAEGNAVGIFGKAFGTYTSDGSLKQENRWEMPAAWLAVVRDEKVVHWQVYADNDPVRQIVVRERHNQ